MNAMNRISELPHSTHPRLTNVAMRCVCIIKIDTYTPLAAGDIWNDYEVDKGGAPPAQARAPIGLEQTHDVFCTSTYGVRRESCNAHPNWTPVAKIMVNSCQWAGCDRWKVQEGWTVPMLILHDDAMTDENLC